MIGQLIICDGDLDRGSPCCETGFILPMSHVLIAQTSLQGAGNKVINSFDIVKVM